MTIDLRAYNFLRNISTIEMAGFISTVGYLRILTW